MPGSSLGRASRAVALLAAVSLVPATAPGGAQILERRLALDLGSSGFTLTEDLRVRLEEAGDLDAWSDYPVFLDKDVQLETCDGEILDASGRRIRRLGRRDQSRQDSVGFGLYTTQWANLVHLEPLEVGQTIRLHIVTRHTPYYPAHALYLGLRWPQQRLDVRLTGAASAWRWRIDGDANPFTIEEKGGSLTLQATDLEGHGSRTVDPGDDPQSAVLRLAWGEAHSWPAVGQWYSQLVAALPADPLVARQAEEICAGLTTPRDKLEALSVWVKRQVRYEAVEMGIGGYVPSPGGEVLKRAWGDCKDKAHLLSRMLAAVSIPSHLVLLRAGERSRIDQDSPTPFQFNHCILAVPAGAAGARAGDPVSEEMLFIDPTYERGKVAWLAPSDQDRTVLLVDGAASRLLRTPAAVVAEERRLEIRGTVSMGGVLQARARVRLRGVAALAWLNDVATGATSRLENDLRSFLGRVLPGAAISNVVWQEQEGDIPAIDMEAEVTLRQLVRGEAGSRYLRATALAAFPEARVLDGRRAPLVLNTGVWRTLWQLSLPQGWCPAAAAETLVENDAGRLLARVSTAASGELTIERRAEVGRGYLAPNLFSALRDLSVAESRASSERILLRCP